MIPPLPFETSLERYRNALVERFDTSASQAEAKARELVATAEAHQKKEAALPANTEGLQTRIDKAKELVTSANKVLAEAQAYKVLSRGAEGAAEFAQRSLDLQIGKAGGLLAFNGLVIAVGTLLWTTVTPSHLWIARWLLGCMLASSVLTLLLIMAWWSGPEHYKSAAADLKKSLRIGSLRAWTLNLAVLLSIASVGFVTGWIGYGTGKTAAAVTIAGPLAVTATNPLPVTLKGPLPAQPGVFGTDGATLKCLWKEQPAAKKGSESHGTLDCRASR